MSPQTGQVKLHRLAELISNQAIMQLLKVTTVTPSAKYSDS